MNNKDINNISLKAFTYIFNELVNGNQRFCFILGSGISREAGILTGKEMTKIWISELKDKYEENELKKLMNRFGVENLEATSENYFSIYDLRYYPDYRHGQAFLEQELEKGVPGLGHYILAKILTDGRNNIAITTNFDSLLEDAIIKHTGKKVILIGHEALSQYVNINISKPIIVKIHRGLYYNPLNRKEELNDLKDEWKEILRQIFWVYTPVVIGYAGGDQSLMQFLKENNLKLNGLYWCYWNKEEPSEEIKRLVFEKNGCFVPIDGFEEMMFMFSQRLGLNKVIEEDKTLSTEILSKYYNFCKNNGKIKEKRIPKLVTLFDIYEVKRVEDLQIKKRWEQNEVYRSLAVTVGLGRKGEHVELNLHEKNHGPHGLIAGATGTGKSEFIQSYILSLAINFSPQEINFFIIDCKGGKAGYKLEGLPHVLGITTDLDEEYVHYIFSFSAELRRRQYILKKYDINHIDKYIRLFKQKKVQESLPHLLIICDEFAIIKRENPELFAMLLTLARVGRSLGIHLILTTQRPAGVVDDQIWVTSNFRVCFKLQEEFDSREVLRTPDAAYITNVGQAYLQVRNNEVYEWFQVPWSNALCQEESRENKYADVSKTQRENIITHIMQIYSEEKVMEVRKICLSPLPNMIVAPYSCNVNNIEVLDMTLGIGIIDNPEGQTQQEYIIDFSKNGHVLYMASDGYGKSVFIANIIIGLAIKNSDKNLNFFIIDMSNDGLYILKNLTHVKDYFCPNDDERIKKFHLELITLMQERRQIISEAKVKNIYQYNQDHEDKIPTIIVVINNHDRISALGDHIGMIIDEVSLEVDDLGIYLAVTISKIDAIKWSTIKNFEEKIAGFNYVKEDITGLVGPSHITLSENKKGRALIRLNTTKLMQLYTPVYCEDENTYQNELAKLIDTINNNCTQEKNQDATITGEA